MITNHKKILLSLAVSTTLLSSSLLAQGSDQMVQSIMKLRGDVEALHSGIQENKLRYESEMKSLYMQTTDTEAQINRHTTSLKLAKSELQKIKTKISKTTSGDTQIKPLVISAINTLEKSIQDGIPFMTQKRIESLEKIKLDLNEGLITPEKALALTWANYDDTIRVTKEIGLFKQEIEMNGQKVLAKIAKIGSVMMFFSTPKDEVGHVVKTESGYDYKRITNPEDIKKIVALFDALQKQIRTGFFELPNALVLQGSN